MLVGCGCVLIRGRKKPLADRPSSVGGEIRSSVVCTGLCIKSIIIFEVLIFRPNSGPTLLQMAGAAHHLTADLDGRCDPKLLRPRSTHSEAPGQPQPKPTNQQNL